MATPITTFSVRITTGKAGGAGTDGNVYIGMCGREFRIDSAIDDFERNTDNTYIFGAGSNVNNSFTNDPRSLYPVSVEDIEPFPAYIRFDGMSLSLLK
jgi:hypothetical protein